MKQPTRNSLPPTIFYSAQDSKACVPVLLEALQQAMVNDAYWQPLLASFKVSKSNTIHLGVFIEPYLQLIIEGKKTLESRFSINRTAPYCKVQNGDLLLLKRSGGPIVGICQITHAWSYTLDAAEWDTLKSQHAKALCIQSPAFWEEKKKANYATLMKVRHVRIVEPSIPFVKSDRRGWLAL